MQKLFVGLGIRPSGGAAGYFHLFHPDNLAGITYVAI
jgi:hypothetical protein